MEFIKQKGLPRLITYITNRNVKFSSTTARQRALEILLDLIVNERVLAFMKQDHLFLFHVKNLRLSSSEQGLQQAAQAIIEKLDTKEDLIEVAEKQDNLTNTSDTSAIANYDIIISYSYADIDSCRWISGQLMNDKFRVKFGLGLHRRSKVKTSTEAVEQSEVGYV